ncbi:hypothetical protein LTR62_003459 [Meristemomyces frigidus]|uniref:Xylanolytic transcriptional activator regulatory domain-containing protein n=1 Tax=Meristemomyces frigidus TaxID=1508187 RepID=A0AAN7YGX7_9PEZI|nr:hypothetical protein LTR62_003459 [Meristemomyces frigidus]
MPSLSEEEDQVLSCVPSARKARARHTSKRAVDSELKQRISKLESLVESLGGEAVKGQANSAAEVLDLPEEQDGEDGSSPTIGQYLSSPFWNSLTIEVQAIRDALEDGEVESPDTPPEAVTANDVQLTVNDFDLLVAPAGAIYIVPGALVEPPVSMQRQLLNDYFQNINPMLKLLHEPTARALLEYNAPYMGRKAAAPCNQALRAVVWYAAINSLSPEECASRYGQAREDLMRSYRRSVDVYLAQADLMITTEIATVQAFAIYLAASRMTDVSRRGWTLTSLLVRVGRAMGLDRRAAGRTTPFEQQMRRRLWHVIRFLDVFAARDRGTETLIQEGSYDVPLPNSVNDDEFDETSAEIPNHTEHYTDMFFSLLAFDGIKASQRLGTPEYCATGDTWQLRLEFAQEFCQEVEEKYLSKCDPSQPFQRLVITIGSSMSKGTILRAIRPIEKHVSSTPPRVDSPYVLETATDALSTNEKVYTDPDFAQWRWLVWVQWHALAVMMAGLCSIRNTELADRAWQCAGRNYERQLRYVADSQHGMLWQPIHKLYKKAAAFRDAGRRESASSSVQQRVGLKHADTLPPQQTVRTTPPLKRQQTFPLADTNPINPTYTQGGSHHSQPRMPIGSIPMDPMMSTPMDFSFVDGSGLTTALEPLPQNNGVSQDLGWLDWESIMQDMNYDPGMGDMQVPMQLQSELDWANNLQQDFTWANGSKE